MLGYFFILSFFAAAVAKPIGTIGSVTKQEVVQKLSSGSELVALYTEPAYNYPIYVLSVHGDTSYDQGYDAGVLFGKQTSVNYQNLFMALFKDLPAPLEPSLQAVTEAFLQWQWNDYLSVEVPEEYLEEIRGLDAGGESIGVKGVGAMITNGITLANLPGDGEDIIYVLIDEFQSLHSLPKEQLAALPTLRAALSHYGHQCSMFGIWGSRTVNGNLFSARNLDWITDLGINQYKLLTVHHPPGGTAHVTVGFGGIWGAMAGMSAEGLTVHEANLESDLDTFRGFPWILRLRHVMAHTATLNEALDMWNSTNNTVGFNHMVGSAKEKRAVALETMKGFTAVFNDMDEREANAIDPDTGDVYGYPLVDALYRTNHGYDEVTQEHYQWYGYHAYLDSKQRYKKIYDYFVDYAENNVLVGAAEAVVVTSAIGIKGDGSDEDNCNEDLYLEGANILSVTYDPAELTLYTAFEDGTGEDWVPAACNGYIKIDMKQWF